VDDCRGGKVRAGGNIRLCGGGDAAQQGEISGAPTAALMKGPWQLHRRGPGTGAAATTTAKGSLHGGDDDDDGVPATVVCATVTSLVVRRQ
jgi:hypothetical protein